MKSRCRDASAVKPDNFEYFAPASVEEALRLLADDSLEAKVLAGGQSLIPMMNLRLARPECLVDINGLSDLSYIRKDTDGLHLGALTRHVELLTSPAVQHMIPLVHEAAGLVAHSQVRNRGTLGGTLAHADAAAEIPTALLASDATITARSLRGDRQIAMQDFFAGYFTTALEHDELLIDVFVPVAPPHSGSSFQEFARRKGDYAIGGAAVVLTLDDLGHCESARIALLASGPSPFRATEAEQFLMGRSLDEDSIAEAARVAAAAAEPVESVHGTPAYRRAVIEEMVARGLRRAITKAGV